MQLEHGLLLTHPQGCLFVCSSWCTLLAIPVWSSIGRDLLQDSTLCVEGDWNLTNFSLYEILIHALPFVCSFVLITPENPYFASRSGLEVKPLGVYPLGPWWTKRMNGVRELMIEHVNLLPVFVCLFVWFELSFFLQVSFLGFEHPT